MSIYVLDTFTQNGSFHTKLQDRFSPVGVKTLIKHKLSNPAPEAEWALTKAGRLMPTNAGGYKAMHQLFPDMITSKTLDIFAKFYYFKRVNDSTTSITFCYDENENVGYSLSYNEYNRVWSLSGEDGVLGKPFGWSFGNKGIDVHIKVEDQRVIVFFDGVEKINVTDNRYRGTGRVGLSYFSDQSPSVNDGLHLDYIMVADAGENLPAYVLTYPETGNFTPFSISKVVVELIKNIDAESIEIVPKVEGVIGKFIPESTVLGNTEKIKSFDFYTELSGEASMSTTNSLNLMPPPITKITTTLSGPIKEKDWAATLYQRSRFGNKPFKLWDLSPNGGGYWLDGDHHYDPLNTFQKIEKYSKRKGLSVQDYSEEKRAALISWRDYAVLAEYPEGKKGGETPGVQGWHAILQGIADHYIESGYTDKADVRAANVLLPEWDEWQQNRHTTWYNPSDQRGNAFTLSMAVDRARMKLGDHPAADLAAHSALSTIDEICRPESEKKYGISFKPFMGGLMMWALIKYWNYYRNDASRSSIIDVIPREVKRFANYIYDNTYYKPGTSPDGWPHGALYYADKNMDDASLKPVTGLKIEKFDSNNRHNVYITRPNLSDKDDFYKYSVIAPDNIADGFPVAGYSASEKKIVVGNYYPFYDEWKEGSTFSLTPSLPGDDLSTNSSAGLNHMVAPAFAWAYWHEKIVLGNIAEGMKYRAKFHEMWNSGAMEEPWSMKAYSQNAFWGIDGLEWAEEADSFAGDVVVIVDTPFTDIVDQEVKPGDYILYTYNWKLELGVVRQTVKGWCKIQLFYSEGDKVVQKDVAFEKSNVKALKVTDVSSYNRPSHLAAKAYWQKMYGSKTKGG